MKFLWKRSESFGSASRVFLGAASLCLFLVLDAAAQFGCHAAPELSGSGNWMNLTRPLYLKELKGKVVLLDFWTDSCINCIHALPKLKELEGKYGKSLVVIGVRSPKYDNEKSDCVVKSAILKFGMNNPVVNDPNSVLWRRYGVNYWPTFVLINQTGAVVGQISGDQQFDKLDKAIGNVIAQARHKGDLDDKSQRYKLLVEQPDKKCLRFPEKIIASDKPARLYISDSGHNRILIVTTDGHLENVVGNSTAGRADGCFANSQFNAPHGLALLGNKLYIADTGNNLIRAIDLSSQTVTTVAGRGDKSPPSKKRGTALSMQLDAPQDLCLIGNNLYIAMSGQHQLWRLNLTTGMAEPIAGTTAEGLKDGMAKAALLAQPTGLTTDGDKIYFADSESSAIRELDPATNVVHTIIGTGLFNFGDKDGSPSGALLQHPLAVYYWNNKLFVADTLNNKIKSFDLKQWSLTTLAGSRQSGCQDGPKAQFSNPDGLTALNGKLYVADTNNDAIRVLDPDSGTVTTLPITAVTAGSKN